MLLFSSDLDEMLGDLAIKCLAREGADFNHERPRHANQQPNEQLKGEALQSNCHYLVLSVAS
jgi:hypothetical protein